jgi:uncharacterized protein (DUF1501 family)
MSKGEIMENFSRRTFLKGVAATTCGSCVHAVSPFSNGGYLAWAGPAPAQSLLGANPLLILVNLDGGSSYNITPIYTGAYRDRNRTISYGPENSIPLTSDQGLHPSLTGLKSVWDEGKLALLNLVGLNDPTGLTRSHLDGANVKLTGITNVFEVKAGVTPGWVLRLSAHYGETFSGMVLNSSRSSITVGGSNPPLSITTLDELGEQSLIREEVGEWTRFTRGAILGAGDQVTSANQTMIRNTMLNIDGAFERLGRESQVTLPTIANPFNFAGDQSGFIRACRDAARLIVATSLKVRFIYLELGGFDTHGNEKGPTAGLLNTLNNGLSPLIQTIKASGRWNDTIIATITEFARTHENLTGGSDHGAAASMFVMGGRVKGRQVNPIPTVTEINRGDFFENATIDFRHVFYDIIAAMGPNPDDIFPYRVTPRPLGLF